MTANVIIRQVLLKRGNTAATSVYTGPVGEAVVDTDLKTLRIQDGLTAGGTLLATADSVTQVAGTIGNFTDGLDAANVAIDGLTANAASQAVAISALESNTASLAGSIIAANVGMKSYVDAATELLWANAAGQASTLSILLVNAAAQGTSLNTLTANAVTQHQTLAALTSNAAVQTVQLEAAAANAAVQSQLLDVLVANAAAQGQYLDSLLANTNTETSGLWANAAIQETEISDLRANIIATNAAIVTANTSMKEYVDALSLARTGEITFTGRTIGATSNGDSGIVFDSAGNGEIHIMDYTGINNPNPEHWLHIGDSGPEAGQNTGDLAIDFNNGQDTHTGHVTWTWDWWDSTLPGYKGTHNDGTGTHARFVLLKDHGFDAPLITVDYASSNVTVADFYAASGTFSGNVNAQNVIIGSDVKWGNGTPFLSGVINKIDAANVAAKNYTDTSITNLVNGAPAVLDTLYEIANSLGNNTSLSTTLLGLISNIEVNVSTLTLEVGDLFANAATQSIDITNLWANAATQHTEIGGLNANINAANAVVVSLTTDLRANINAANTAIITNLSYTNQLNVAMTANVEAANAAIVTANVDMKGYVDDQIDAVTGNIQINDTTITTKVGANPTIILDAGGEVVIRDNTGIGNENPGWLLHVGDALKDIPDSVPYLGQLAVDYAAGLPYVDGLPPPNNNGRRGSVVFDWQYWTSGGFGNYNLRDNAAYREFGLYRDGDHNHELFAVDLDTHEFRVNSLVSTANIHSLGSFTGNVRTDGYFFANGAPLVIPPLVKTGSTAPTIEEGATEGALWWNDGDGRAYIKYGNDWIDLSPTVLPPVSRYIGNVVFSNHNITNVGNITPHANDEYNLGTSTMRWNAFYTDTIDTTGNVSIGGNLYVYGNVTNVATTSLIIDDSLVYLANSNPGNSIDIGIVGNFNDGTYQHTGFVRDASDNVWKLFSNVIAEPTNTVDFTGAVYDAIRVGNITSPTVTDLYSTIATANLNMNNRVTDLNSQMTANVTAANLAIVTANNAVVSHIVDLNGQMLANVNAANSAIVTANNAVVSHIVDLNGQMIANVNAANTAIVTANNAVVSHILDLNDQMSANVKAANSAIIAANLLVVNYVNDRDSELLANITAANAAIVTANNAVVSHIVDLNSQMIANVNAANAAAITANLNMKTYVDAHDALKANIADPTFTGTVTFNNPGNVTVVGNLTIGNSAVVLGNLQVQGTTTTVNQTSLSITDKFITLANGSINSSMANGAGLYVPGAEANVLYSSINDSWTVNKPLYFNSNVVWHAGNDGGGSGLDADTLDGLHASDFLKLNPDGDGVVINYSDQNPIVNGYYIQGTWAFGADGNVFAGAIQSKMFNANGHVNSTGGYYVGSADPYGSSATTNTTKVIGGDGTIYPTAGSGTAGIIFPNDPGGGGGDGASIKYYAVSGERTVLEIKTTNDADDDVIINSSGVTQVVNNFQVSGSTIIKGISEAFSALSGASGVVTHNCSDGTIFYHTSPAANFTVNLTNLKCDSGYGTSATLIVTQGATAYIPNALQIGGATQTINWQGGSIPTGSANKKDIVSFSILNNSGTYVVFGQLATFG